MSSKEVKAAVGEAPAKRAKSAVELLQEKRAALVSARARYAAAKANRDEVTMAEATRLAASLTVLITELEQEAAGLREQDAVQRAKERVLGISRAVGSVVASMKGDEEKVVEAGRAYAEAVERLNERYRQYEGLVAEDAGLRDRFGIGGAKVPRVISPNENERVVAAVRTIQAVAYATDRVRSPQIEKDEYGLRERRTYGEIRGTSAYTIIESVGPKPWRALTEREREYVAASVGERETNSQFLGELELEATIANALGAAGVPGGDVHRG